MDNLIIAGKTFQSRLIVGTGKYSSPAVMVKAHEASGADMVTVAVRRVEHLAIGTKESLLDYIDTSKYFLLPNTAGCYTADEAIRTARLGREAGLSNWVKLEVIGDERTLFPDNEALLEATRVLVKEGFVVLPYTNDDPVVCRKLEDAGAAAVMPLGAPIGSGLGIQNVNNIRIIREFARVPVIVDAGVGHRVRRGARDGAGRRRRADEHGDRRRAGSGRDGRSDEAGGQGRPAGLPGRPDSAEAVREREQSGRRAGRALERLSIALARSIGAAARPTTILVRAYCVLPNSAYPPAERISRTQPELKPVSFGPSSLVLPCPPWSRSSSLPRVPLTGRFRRATSMTVEVAGDVRRRQPASERPPQRPGIRTTRPLNEPAPSAGRTEGRAARRAWPCSTTRPCPRHG